MTSHVEAYGEVYVTRHHFYNSIVMNFFICQKTVINTVYYAALLPRRGPHIASDSVCLSARLSR